MEEYYYRECLRNHAASLGSYATDGCGEFTGAGGGSLSCAACGCHRNFHRKLAADCRSTPSPEPSRKKRIRTKFTSEQKEKMVGFAEGLGWKLQRIRKKEEDEIERFCSGIGITRRVFKIWIHNHKTTHQ
ncbi:hypothetical protein M569_04589 [Genlisea aurea]|uniref:ZF-HD dimerization-type domain-containing protein n=1 Tax=Genlisea aurea TaxID=192259 RepID=S8EC70_9LAMI|nr:hypothetical protein M569_04589 [Genlisea aurea]